MFCLNMKILYKVRVWIQLIPAYSAFAFLCFFFFLAVVVFDFSTCLLYTFHQLVHCSQQNKWRSAHQWVPFTVHISTNITFQQLFSLKMGFTALFIHLKIILLQCFQFLISATFNFSNNKLNPNRPKYRLG